MLSKLWARAWANARAKTLFKGLPLIRIYTFKNDFYAGPVFLAQSVKLHQFNLSYNRILESIKQPS